MNSRVQLTHIWRGMSPVHGQGAKRRRIDLDSRSDHATFTSANEIDQALRTHSTISPATKESINRFKDFVATISKHDEPQHDLQKRLQILRDYCNLQTAPSKEHVDFPDLLATWSKAVESGNDPVASAVPAALAQFFKAISGVFEFRDFGLSLCHSLLKRSQIRLLDRGLSSPRSKEHLISPCLRLLTEITSFDAGIMANNVFHHRDILFRRLDSLLDTRSTDPTVDRRRPTVRRMALRLVIANLRFLDNRAKSEYLTQYRTFRAVAQRLTNDGDDILLDIMKAVESGVVDDSTISRTSKLKFFTSDLLSAISMLYSYEADASHAESTSAIRNSAHKLLLKVCTTSKGIVLSQSGWYPVGYNLDAGDIDRGDIDLGLDSPLYFDSYSDKLPVKNTTISSFCRLLKPETDVLQAELILKAFTQIPELVAEYLIKSRPIVITAGDDSQWRGRFAFLFSVVQIPVPMDFGWIDGTPRFPPPISVVIESILPKPFDSPTLARFFSLNDEMLILAGSRLLSVALSKLGYVLSKFDEHRAESALWTQASQRLIELVLSKVPKYKDLTDAYQRCGKGNAILSTALFECMATYYRLLPEAVGNSKFDVAPILVEAIQQTTTPDRSDDDSTIEQISWLIKIAELSSATKWWSKSSTDNLTLFTTILRFVLLNEDPKAKVDILHTMKATIISSGLVNGSATSFQALIYSLTSTKDFVPSEELFAFVDTSLFRTVTKPVRYLDRIESEQHLASDKTPVSLLACGVAEQWSFALQKYSGQKTVLKNIAKWIARYFSALDNVGENFRVLLQFKEDMLKTGEAKPKEYLQSSFDKQQKKTIQVVDQSPFSELPTIQKETDENPGEQQLVDLDQVLGPLVRLPTSIENIDRWDSNTDIEHAIQSGRISQLIRCTASSESEVRNQAFHSLLNLAYIVDNSDHTEKHQIYLLLGEICETIRQHGSHSPVPSIVPELGVTLLDIINDPAHQLFSKANKFLLRSPSWDTQRLIQRWTDAILFTEPDSDEPNSWTTSVEWYTSWLANGLKTPADMEVYRQSGVFEKLLALYSSPATVRSTQKMILTVLWRAICAGGADTLITRVGLHAWLDANAVTDKEHASIIRRLSRSLADARTSSVIDAWERSCPALLKKD